VRRTTDTYDPDSPDAPGVDLLKSLAYPGLLVGLALFTTIVVYQGVAEIARRSR
jgi:hypothetical protein